MKFDNEFLQYMHDVIEVFYNGNIPERYQQFFAIAKENPKLPIAEIWAKVDSLGA